MSAIDTFLPGSSLLHRAPAAVKLGLLLALAVGLAVLPRWWSSLAAVGVVLLGYPLAGLSWRSVRGQLRPLVWVLLAIGVAQLVLSGWRTACDVVATVVALVLAAGAVTLTTTTTAMSDLMVALLRPFRRSGVAPERLGLLVALSIRSVAVVSTLATQIRDAQRARGLASSPRAFAVPLLVRSLRHAARLGEALTARGFDD